MDFVDKRKINEYHQWMLALVLATFTVFSTYFKAPPPASLQQAPAAVPPRPARTQRPTPRTHCTTRIATTELLKTPRPSA